MYNIIRYNSKYKEGVSELLLSLWSDNKDENMLFFSNKYERNPYDDQIYAIIALHNNVVVGFRGFVPTEWIIGKQKKIILLVSDASVHINHRRKGLFEKMTKKSIELFEKTDVYGYLNLSSNKYSTPGYLKLGWRKFDLKTYHRFTTPISLLLLYFNISKKKIITNKNIKIDKYLTDVDYLAISRFCNLSDNLALFNKKAHYKYKLLRQNNYKYIKYYSSDNVLVSYAVITTNGLMCTIIDFDFEEIKYFKSIIKELRRQYYIVSIWDVSIKNLGIRNNITSILFRYIESKRKQPLLFRPAKSLYKRMDLKIDGLTVLDASSWKLREIYSE